VNNTKKNQNSRCLGRDSNLEPREYKSKMIPVRKLVQYPRFKYSSVIEAVATGIPFVTIRYSDNCLPSRCLGIAHIRVLCIPFLTQRPLAVFVAAGTCPVVSRCVAMGLGSDNPAMSDYVYRSMACGGLIIWTPLFVFVLRSTNASVR
jgi:hypothetical protein